MDSLRAFNQIQTTLHQLAANVELKDYKNSTPCSKWDVRDLLNHIVSELAWMPELAVGKTVAEVGDKYDGDLIGNEPHKCWEQASQKAQVAVSEPGYPTRTIHLSYGDKTGEYYLREMTIDQTIHAWDLAQGLGLRLEISQDLAEFCYDHLKPQAEAWRQSGEFGPLLLKVDENMSALEKILTLSGRNSTEAVTQS